MAETIIAGTFPVWDKFPRDIEYRLDDSVPYGTYQYRAGEGFFISSDTAKGLREFLYGHLRPATEKKTRRAEILDEAKSLTTGDRNSQYGEPIDDFRKVADALNAYGYKGPGGRKMMPRDVPFFQALVKLSRIVQSPTKNDSWVDLAGYAAVGGEVAAIEGDA